MYEQWLFGEDVGRRPVENADNAPGFVRVAAALAADRISQRVTRIVNFIRRAGISIADAGEWSSV